MDKIEETYHNEGKMTEEENKQSSELPPAEYAGPPKSHTFKDETTTSQNISSPVIEPASQQDTTTLPKTDTAVSKNQTENQIKIPPHAPAHIGMLSEEEAEKEILDIPTKQPALIDLIADPADNPEEQPKKKFEFKWHFDPKIFKKYKDEVRDFFKKYPMIYKAFQATWICLMLGIYIGGIAFFSIFFVLYFAFTPLLKSYLDARGLSNIEFTVASHSLSDLTIKDIRDKNGLFSIKTLRLQYTFTNFLKGKITLADVDTLEIFIKQTPQKGYNVRDLMMIFLKLGLMDKNSPMHVQSLQFKNSKIFLDNKEFPIDFSGIGDLEVQRQFVIPFTIQNEYITANASLTTELNNTGTIWTITLDNGKLTLPQLPAEDLSGTLVFNTKNTHFRNFNADLTLKQENSEKKLKLQILPTQNNRLNANLSLDIPSANEQKPIQIELTLRNVELSNDLKAFSTDDPLNIKITNITSSFLTTQTLQASLNGKLNCKNNLCSFKQERPSDIILFSPIKKIWDTEFKASYPLRLTITPSKNDLFVLDKRKLSFDAILRKSSFNLTKQKSTNETESFTISTGETTLKGEFDLLSKKGTLETNSENVSISDDVLKLSRAKVETRTNMEGSSISISSPSVSLTENDLLKVPFALQLQITPDQYFSMLLQTSNRQVTLNANGYFSPFTGEILAAVETQPIVFKKGNLQPHQISGIISDDLKEVSGTISLRGQFHWKNDRSIDGPMNIALDKVSFDYGNTKINNLTTMMEVTSFVPFGTKRNQEAFIESILTTLPFTNIGINYYFDASKKQLNISRMNMELADIIFRIDPSWLTYQSPVQSISFKAKNIDLEKLVPYVNLNDFNMQGNISNASFSLQMNDENVFLKNMELTIPQDGSISYQPDVFTNTALEIFKNLTFKKATVILNELENQTIDFLFIGDNTNPQDKRKTTIRFNITEPLHNFIKTTKIEAIPDEVSEKMKLF